jgi:hypothetical protein
VEGGKDYKGGWRLPGAACRPDGTTQYKDRALQSPFRSAPNGLNELFIELNSDEASDLMNFVLKDDATNTWCVHPSWQSLLAPLAQARLMRALGRKERAETEPVRPSQLAS